jgi:uncharacterized HAD superfamily protein
MPLITVDFDHTLAYEDATMQGGWVYVGSGILLPIQKICDLVREKARDGYQIDIVTFRQDENLQEIRDFIRRQGLPITNIHNTEGESKTPMLKQLNSQLHIDDVLSVVISAEKAGIPCLLVNGNGEYDNNSTADLFNKVDVSY